MGWDLSAMEQRQHISEKMRHEKREEKVDKSINNFIYQWQSLFFIIYPLSFHSSSSSSSSSLCVCLLTVCAQSPGASYSHSHDGFSAPLLTWCLRLFHSWTFAIALADFYSLSSLLLIRCTTSMREQARQRGKQQPHTDKGQTRRLKRERERKEVSSNTFSLQAIKVNDGSKVGRCATTSS